MQRQLSVNGGRRKRNMMNPLKILPHITSLNTLFKVYYRRRMGRTTGRLLRYMDFAIVAGMLDTKAVWRSRLLNKVL